MGNLTKHSKIFIWAFYAALAAAGLWLAFRFFLPWIMPFLLALITARIIEPLVGLMTRKFQFRRGFAAFVASGFALLLMLLLLFVLVHQAINGIGILAQNLPDVIASVGQTVGRLEAALYHFLIAAPPETQNMILSAIESFGLMLEELPTQISSVLLGAASTTAQTFPRVFLFVVTYGISVLFISMSYPQVMDFLRRQVPKKWRGSSEKLAKDMKQTGIKWCKAQLKLISVTFVILSIAFFVLGIPYALLLAVFIALIDALPVFGTGTVLIPWGIFSLLAGNFPLGGGILLTYMLVSITHSVMEPRFVGAQIGLHPLATLMAMYLGFRLIGVLGMISFPLLFIIIKQFHDNGYVKLWR